MKKKYIMPEFVVYLVSAENICELPIGSGNAQSGAGGDGDPNGGDGFSKGNGMWEYMDNDD